MEAEVSSPADQPKDSGQPDQETKEEPQTSKEDAPTTPRKTPRKKTNVKRFTPDDTPGMAGTDSLKETETKRIPSPKAPTGPPPGISSNQALATQVDPQDTSIAYGAQKGAANKAGTWGC